MSETESIIQNYWNELPRPMRVELIQDGANTKTILQRAAVELGVELEFESSQGHVTKNEIAEFTVAVMEKYDPKPNCRDGGVE